MKRLNMTKNLIIAVGAILLITIMMVLATSGILAKGIDAKAATNDDKSEVTHEVTKTATWTNQEKTEADITLTAHTNEKINTEKYTPKFLFLGTMCSAHTLTKEKLCNAINALTEIGEVDYYLLNNNDPDNAKNDIKKAHLKKGQTIKDTDIPTMPTGNHQALYKFFDALYETRETAYDNIVFEFDTTRIADYYGVKTGERTEEYYNPPDNYYIHEQQDYIVNNILKDYYKNNKVIWIVDEGNDTSKSLYSPAKEFGARKRTDLVLTNSESKIVDQFKALIGLTAPDYYANSDDYYENGLPHEYALGSDRQLLYSDSAEKIKEKVNKAVNSLIYKFSMKDTVLDSSQLEIVSVKAYSKTSEGEAWCRAANYFICVLKDNGRLFNLF